MVSATDDNCEVNGMKFDVEWFMTELEKRLKMTRCRIIKKHIGVNCEWSISSDRKVTRKATMGKKSESTIAKHKEHIAKVAKVHDYPGKSHKCLGKHEGEPIGIDERRPLVGQFMFFETKLAPKLVNTTRVLVEIVNIVVRQCQVK